jgi:hypothetical protein
LIVCFSIITFLDFTAKLEPSPVPFLGKEQLT